MSKNNRFIITLEAPGTPEDPDGIQRLKRWLKRSWRDYCLRCVDLGKVVTSEAAGDKVKTPAGPSKPT